MSLAIWYLGTPKPGYGGYGVNSQLSVSMLSGLPPYPTAL